jgi:hypothetical protein
MLYAYIVATFYKDSPLYNALVSIVFLRKN